MVDKLDGQAKVAVPNSNQMVISIRVNGRKVDGLAILAVHFKLPIRLNLCDCSLMIDDRLFYVLYVRY